MERIIGYLIDWERIKVNNYCNYKFSSLLTFTYTLTLILCLIRTGSFSVGTDIFGAQRGAFVTGEYF